MVSNKFIYTRARSGSAGDQKLLSGRAGPTMNLIISISLEFLACILSGLTPGWTI